MVPNGWEVKILEDLASVERGKFSARPRNDPKYYGGEIPFVQTGDIAGAKTYLKSYSQTLNEEGLKVSRLFPKNTILITIAANIGDVAITSFDVACPDSLVAIQPKENADVVWLYFYLETCQKELDGQATQNAQKNINLQVLRPLKILTPPLLEQQKIAKILSTWDRAISTTERLIDNSTQQKKALMQQLLTGKKRLLDESGKPFAGEWESRLFKNILKLDRGSSPRPIVKYMTDSEDGVNWIKIGDTKGEGLYINSTKERITKEGAEKSRKVFKGEVVLSNSMSYGKPYILNIDGYIHDGWFVIRKFEKNIDVNFLIQILSSELIQRQYKRLAAGGVVSNISSELVYAVKINLPSIPEQQKIATVLTNADKEIELLKQQLADLQQEKKALMQVLLTGKVRVLVNGG